LICVELTTVAARFVGTEGAVTSGGAGVVAEAATDGAELFPAASYAATVQLYVVEGVNPVF
jgi:hypothetical protein